ncbi:MAG: aspartate-semialdehyde dehydrogenase [Chloroflexi bacterium]|nr:aspartate-semialdehyde dehydrogenase [Chloroflexota bacterium]
MTGYKVAIVGATGMVGREYIKILEQRKFPMNDVKLLASERSTGKKVTVNGQALVVKETSPEAFKGTEIVFLAAEADISRQFSPIAAAAGAVVVDDSSAFRLDPKVPLVVPEVNAEDIKGHKGIVAGPNCSTIQLVVALHPLHRVNPIKRVIVATYQSVSGWGAAAMDELRLQARKVLDGEAFTPRIFPYQIAFNVLPEIDKAMANDYTKEEWKMSEETHKIMHASEIAFSATCVRVPVFVGHSEAVWIEFSRPMSPAEARDILSRAPGIRIVDDIAASQYPHPLAAAGRDETYVGRIREDTSLPNGLVMWIVSDNVRKGSALNGVQIAEAIIKRNWLKPGG